MQKEWLAGQSQYFLKKTTQKRSHPLATIRGVRPTACGPRAAQDGYECGLTQNHEFTWNHFFFCPPVFVSIRVFNVWPKTTLLLPAWPRDAKRLDTPDWIIFHCCQWGWGVTEQRKKEHLVKRGQVRHEGSSVHVSGTCWKVKRGWRGNDRTK